MRINKFVALASGMSRRAADTAIAAGTVTVDGRAVAAGADVSDNQEVRLNGQHLRLPVQTTTVMLNKPVGYVCSRSGQGSRTIYELLPPRLHHLKPVGRLDKDSSGLLLLTNDGGFANRLTHPRYGKLKTYQLELNLPLMPADKAAVETGVQLKDGLSRLQIESLHGKNLTVIIGEGRNRQIRRTFAALGYEVKKLHRTAFGPYKLSQLTPDKHYDVISQQSRIVS